MLCLNVSLNSAHNACDHRSCPSVSHRYSFQFLVWFFFLCYHFEIPHLQGWKECFETIVGPMNLVCPHVELNISLSLVIFLTYWTMLKYYYIINKNFSGIRKPYFCSSSLSLLIKFLSKLHFNLLHILTHIDNML